MLPLWSSISSTFKSSDDKAADDKPKDDTGSKTIEEPVNKEDQAYRDELDRLTIQEKEANDAADAFTKDTSGTFSAGGPSSPYPDAFILANTLLHVDQNDSQIPDLKDTAELRSTELLQEELLQFSLQKVWRLVDLPYGKKAIRTKWVYKNKKDKNKDRLVVQGHKQEERIDYDEVYVDNIIFGSTKKSLCDEFEALMHKRFQMSSMGELTFFLGLQMSSMGELTFFLGLQVKQSEEGIFISQDKYVAEILKKFDFSFVKTTSTPIETSKPLVKDEEATDVDVHLYKSMIRSLMYLTASRPDIIDSQFDLEAYSDSDYAGANLDKKSTTGGGGDSLVWAATTASLDARQNTSNITKTQSKATLNEPTPQGEGSGGGLGRQETMGSAMAQIRYEGALIQSIDPPLLIGYTVGSGEDRMEHDIKLMDLVPQTPHDSPLSGGHTPGSDEGSITLKELTDLCTTLLQKVLDLENVKTAQEKDIVSLKKSVTKLKQRQSLRILGFHPFRAGTSKRHNLGRRKISKQGRKNLKSQQMFQDIDDVLDEDADTEMIVEDKGNGEKGGSTAKTVSIARPDISATRPEKAKEKGIAFKDADDSTRPIRSITTLQPLLTIDAKDKGKGILQKPEPVKKTKKKDQNQIERDAEVALKIQAHLDEEARTE
nr:hypothetical protein [Tanacetum cinerariifolium]